MGLMSRKVLPVCGNMCVCCPALRARSRQPVKRYNMLLAEIYPKNQDEAPNLRKISKLAEYASKNPMRIPKIASALEQKGQKELQNKHHGSVRAVMATYSRLFMTCRDEMSLFAISALNMIRILLDQTRQDDMRILGCKTLVDFIRYQADATYIRNLDALVPTLCALGHEQGDPKKQLRIRAAGLQALADMVGFMGQHSHISTEFDEIVTLALENYALPSVETGTDENERGAQHHRVKEVVRSDSRARAVAAMREAMHKLQHHKMQSHMKDPSNLTREEMEMPSVWSQVCLQNVASLAKEATTVRRMLEPMFRYFDKGRHWSLQHGLALAVLGDIQLFMETTENDQLLLAALVRHLDHKKVEESLRTKTNIIALTAVLTRQSKAKATVAEVGAMSDLLRHLQKSLQSGMETSMVVGDNKDFPEQNSALQTAIEECLMEFGRRVGDAGPVLDMMAATLEKLPTKTVIARSTIQAVSVLALAVAYLPDHLYAHQEFPEALFNELLRAMLHPDVETRIGAHRILVVLLVPASASQSSRYEQQFLPYADVSAAASPTRSRRRVSAFASAAVLFERLRKERSTGSFLDSDDELEIGDKDGQIRGRTNSMGRRLCILLCSAEKSWCGDCWAWQEMTTVRLAGHQVELLFSTLWLEANMADNWPPSYEAIAHTYSLALIFSRPTSSNHATQLRALQLALSLRSLALDTSAIQFSPARRRSLFTLATAMILFAAKTYNLSQIVAPAKVPLTPLKDPFLELTEESTLTAANSAVFAKEYGTPSDDNAALSSLARISLTGDLSNEALAARIVEASPSLVEAVGPGLKAMLIQQFVPEDSDILGSSLYFNSHSSRSARTISLDSISFDELVPAADEEVTSDPSGPELPRLLRDTARPNPTPRAPGVSQLLASALETAAQVGTVSSSDRLLSYSATASQCEAFGAGTHKKLSDVLKLDSKASTPLAITLPNERDPGRITNGEETLEGKSGGESQGLKLPPCGPYDNFLVAAGC
ncbi:unnamed protein product [Sphagnum jensenii]|uniref:Protein EFR3 n=1 Tax=Sphagnum jensenii TaxID=128206 RepID=A0ABP0XLM8_9BRYO